MHYQSKPKRWTRAEAELIQQHYLEWGADALADRMGVRRDQVMNKAQKMGLTGGKRHREATIEVTGGPRKYHYQWKPLQLQQRLPEREGSGDFRNLPSLNEHVPCGREQSVSYPNPDTEHDDD